MTGDVWRRLHSAGGFATLTHWPQIALACPYCDSPIGQEVRASIFNGEFLLNAVLTLLPLPVLLAVVAAIHFGLPRSWWTGDSQPSDPLDVDQ